MPSYQPPKPFSGLTAGLTAFALWGLLVLYWDALAVIPPFEILLHRIFWSFFFLLPFLLFTKRLPAAITACHTKAIVLRLFTTALLISLNWGLFIWGVSTHRVVEASLGYFINPLLNVLLAFFFLRERLLPLQWLAIAIAAAGVLYTLLLYGSFPWLALVLASSFSLYGILRKTAAIDATPGLFLETCLLFVPVATYLVWLESTGQGHFFSASPTEQFLLIASGIATATPLLLFTYASRHLHYSTLGLIQYLSPTMTLLIGLFFLQESLPFETLITFICIWIALFLYSWSSWHALKHHENVVYSQKK